MFASLPSLTAEEELAEQDAEEPAAASAAPEIADDTKERPEPVPQLALFNVG